MAYQLLEKIYYQDKTLKKEKYNQTYQEYYNNLSAIHFDFKIGNYPAFYINIPEITQLIIDISVKQREIFEIMQKLPQQAINNFVISAMCDEIRYSNAIEGVKSTRKQVIQEFNNKSSVSNSSLGNMVEKYKKLLNNEEILLNSCQDIRKLYDELVLQEVLKENKDDAPDGIIFIKDGATIYNERSEIIHYGVSPENKIIEMMDYVLNLIKSSNVPILIKTAITHYLIGYIHPFYNGNGRLNRFISSYLLYNGFEKTVGFNLSATIMKNRSSYDKAFKIVNEEKNRADLTYFIQNFLKIIYDAFDLELTYLREKQEKYIYYKHFIEENFAQKHIDYFMDLLLNSVFCYGELPLNNVNISKQTQKTLAEKYNFIIKNKISRENNYSLDLDIFDSYLKEKAQQDD